MNDKSAPLSAADADQLVVRLRRYNEWRRGADFEQPEPSEIGMDIDAAIAAIEQLNELRSAVREECAKICEEIGESKDGSSEGYEGACADAIRKQA